MTVSAAFTELEEEFRSLEEAASNLSWAVVQGRPSSAIGGSIADRYESAATDFSDLARRARAAAADGRLAAGEHADTAHIRAALLTCQECAIQLVAKYYGDIASCERIEDLNDLSDSGDHDWQKWVVGVRDSLSGYPQMLYSISQTTFRCWQELTEPIGPMSVSAHATSYGQRVIVHSTRHEDEHSEPTDIPGKTIRLDI